MKIELLADIVIGLQYGDEGKGKVASAIAETRLYTQTARYNGGPNAGHTVNLDNGKQLKLHQIPVSVIHKVPGHIGAGCAVNFSMLEQEARDFRKVMGFCPYEYLSISPRAVLIGSGHVKRDQQEQAITQGSTGSGIAPAYASFYDRSARLANCYTWPDKNGRECIQELHNCKDLLLQILNHLQFCRTFLWCFVRLEP